MATAAFRQKIVGAILGRKSALPVSENPLELTVLEQVIFAICREDSLQEKAEAAFRNLQTRFFDWNEVRVSSPSEIMEAISGLTGTRARAERIIAFLQEHFEATYAFDLEGLLKKGVKGTAKQLEKAGGVTDHTVAWVNQRALKAQSIPVDSSMLRCAKRLELVDSEVGKIPEARHALEGIVAKTKVTDFSDGLSRIAVEFCHERNPACQSCPLSGECPSAKAPKGAAAPSGRGRKPK